MSGAGAVSLIVVNYNGERYLPDCLPGLFEDAHAPLEVIVVDNASTDGSRAWLEQFASREARLKLVFSEVNDGYAGGVNRGLPLARGEYVGVLNADLAVERGWLEPLVAFLANHSEVGAVTPLIALAGGARVNAAGQDVQISAVGFNRALNRPLSDIGSEPFPVCGIHGAAFLMRRALLVGIGGMDASGFLYHEDVNLSWLLRLAGYALYCVPRSVVRHDYFLSMFPSKLQLLERNRLALLLSYLEPSTLLALTPALALTEALMWGYCLSRGRDFLRAKWDSYLQLIERAGRIRERREVAASVRAVNDWAVLGAMKWGYDWRQALTLLFDRGTPARHPELRAL
jgi:GT2 family glycosyltransferase